MIESYFIDFERIILSLLRCVATLGSQRWLGWRAVAPDWCLPFTAQGPSHRRRLPARWSNTR